MFKTAAEWQAVWPSFEVHTLEHLERALAALSNQLGIDPQTSEGTVQYSQHVAQFLDRVLEEAKKND